ncbi:MAG: hypothetical protein LBI36_05160 [Oscillospiraceae bacterium]|jgi:uncharacterized membrane protein|nr:hypothetical protein [Oscillospiraceae bacterium]
MKIFEVIMLLCFGAAWPFSVYKSYRSRTAKGKSLIFLLALVAGYISGIINNVINGANYVLFFYALNLLLVSADTALYFRNRRLDGAAGER